MTQAAMARALGVERSQIQMWEEWGSAPPAVEQMLAIATITGASFDWLATGRGKSQLTSDREDESKIFAIHLDQSQLYRVMHALPSELSGSLVVTESVLVRIEAKASCA